MLIFDAIVASNGFGHQVGSIIIYGMGAAIMMVGSFFFFLLDLDIYKHDAQEFVYKCQ